MLEFLASLADRRRVDDRHHFFEIVHDHAIEQILIPVLESDQVQVAVEIGRFLTNIAQNA